MSVQDTAQLTLIRMLGRWVILGILVLTFRFFRWGGIMGLVGIGAFAGAIWLAFRLADPDTGELTVVEFFAVLAGMIAGVALYVVGVRRRRRRRRMPTDVTT